MKTRPLIVYFASNGIGENLQASPAMRELRKTNHILFVCRAGIHLVIDPECYDEIITWTNSSVAEAVHMIKVRTVNEVKPVPWTAHLDPAEFCADLEQGGFIVERRHPFPKQPYSASYAFWMRVNGSTPGDLRMTAREPDIKRFEYNVVVCLGSAEKMRRFPETVAVELCNALNKRGLSVCMHTQGGRHPSLHTKIGVAVNRWGEGTMEQLKELVFGSQIVICPDTGPAHLALAYGKRLFFFESREHFQGVIDTVHLKQCEIIRMENPACDKRCHARRPDFTVWPREPESMTGPNYPHGLACATPLNTPCLNIGPLQIKSVCEHAWMEKL